MKRIIPDENYCLGCKLCEIFCSTEHSESKNVVTAHKYETPPPVSRTRVEEHPEFAISISCRHCDDAPCVEVCMSGALSREDDRSVSHNPDKCVGCWMCVMVCPYGAIKRGKDKSHKKIAFKCDLCPDRSVPACVEACPNGALIMFEEEE